MKDFNHWTSRSYVDRAAASSIAVTLQPLSLLSCVHWGNTDYQS